jgi:nucleotide-binding universal stress UspA family protein
MREAINRILVPVDFSAHSERALRVATTFAARFGAQLELLHIVEDPFVSGAWSAEAFVPNIPELMNDLIADARRRIEALRAIATGEGVLVETTVLTGEPVRTIVDQAATGGFDLIVMGTHGRTGLSHVFIGSVAERVVRKAPCPVLTVREHAALADRQSANAATAVA